MRDAIAPDGFEVRLLARDERGSLAHFQLAAGQTGRAGAHKTVTEIWYVVGGRGKMWRRAEGQIWEMTLLEPGVSVTIPVGTQFQSCAEGSEPLAAIGVTIPAWPLEGEEWYRVEGEKRPTVP